MSLDDLQAQLRGTLDQQFAALKQKYEDGLTEARREAVAGAERDTAAKLEQARAAWDTELRTTTTAVRADAERETAAKLEQARGEAAAQLQVAVAAARTDAAREAAATLEQARAEAAAQLFAGVAGARAELNAARAQWATELHAAAAAAPAEGEQQAAEQAREAHARQLEQAVDHATTTARRTAELQLESERGRAQSELDAAHEQARIEADAERQRSHAELDSLRERMHADVAAARQTAAAGANANPNAAAPPGAPPAAPPAAFERVLAATREIDGARTLSQVLDALLAHAGAAAGRAAIFLINGDRLKAWKTAGIPDVDVQTVESSIGAKDLLARAIQAGLAIPSSAALPAPPFARLPADRAGLAVPLMIGGRAVAVLYADAGASVPAARWMETVETLVRHASAISALRTAMRTLDVLGGGVPDGDGSASAGDVHDDQGARRYARLLVSEIKLYNEAAVRDGRQQRDLLRRLRAEIDRAQRLYDERVPPAVGGRHVYFHQELVQTLADGDPALLGNA
jgi:hypothetical protein